MIGYRVPRADDHFRLVVAQHLLRCLSPFPRFVRFVRFVGPTSPRPFAGQARPRTSRILRDQALRGRDRRRCGSRRDSRSAFTLHQALSSFLRPSAIAPQPAGTIRPEVGSWLAAPFILIPAPLRGAIPIRPMQIPQPALRNPRSAGPADERYWLPVTNACAITRQQQPQPRDTVAAADLLRQSGRAESIWS